MLVRYAQPAATLEAANRLGKGRPVLAVDDAAGGGQERRRIGYRSVRRPRHSEKSFSERTVKGSDTPSRGVQQQVVDAFLQLSVNFLAQQTRSLAVDPRDRAS